MVLFQLTFLAGHAIFLFEIATTYTCLRGRSLPMQARHLRGAIARPWELQTVTRARARHERNFRPCADLVNVEQERSLEIKTCLLIFQAVGISCDVFAYLTYEKFTFLYVEYNGCLF